MEFLSAAVGSLTSGASSSHMPTRKVVNVFTKLDQSAAGEIVAALAHVENIPSLPTDFGNYVQRALFYYQHGGSRSLEDGGEVACQGMMEALKPIETKTKFGKRFKLLLMSAETWKAVRTALAMGQEKGDDSEGLPPFLLHPDERDRWERHSARRSDCDEEELEEMLEVRRTFRAEMMHIVAVGVTCRARHLLVFHLACPHFPISSPQVLNEIEKWSTRCSGLKTAMNARLAYNAFQAFMQLVLEATADDDVNNAVSSMLTMGHMSRRALTWPSVRATARAVATSETDSVDDAAAENSEPDNE